MTKTIGSLNFSGGVFALIIASTSRSRNIVFNTAAIEPSVR
jgi:hypothetical protein